MRRLIWFTLLAWIPGTFVARADVEGSEAGYLYISPVPRASYVSAQTRHVLVRFKEVAPAAVTNLETTFITVTGSQSGLHAGETWLAGDQRTVIHALSGDFIPGEQVTVTLNPLVSAGTPGFVTPYDYRFRVEAPMIGSLPATPGPGPSPVQEPAAAQVGQVAGESFTRAAVLPNGVAIPSGFPEVMISVNSNPSPGHVFLENAHGVAPGFSMIVDNNGQPVWYTRERLLDLKPQKNGLITHTGTHGAGFGGFDQDLNYIRSYCTVNGYLTDAHELEVLENGRYLMLGYRYHTVDLSPYIVDGATNAIVRETVVQEFTGPGGLIFQWRAWDHFDIAETGADFTHMNALDVDEDGHILVSSRQLSEVTKIDRNTGEILWRLGGPHSSFAFVNDPLSGFSFQHDISALGNGRYLLFDNGNTHTPPVSRAVEYQLDLTNMTATLAWEFRDSPDKYAFWMGNAQRLPTGNTLINFVRPQYPKVVEVDPNGTKRFELSLVPGAEQYRAHRFQWNGSVAVPYLIAERAANHVTLIFNKFGDPSVDHYRIYGGTSPAPTRLVAISPSPLSRLTNVVNGARNYFRVTAVDADGVESGFSNEESLRVSFAPAGANLLRNGDFSQGTSGWNWGVRPPASAQWVVTGGSSQFQIASGGTYVTDIQLKQSGLALIQGRDYTLEFDAWSAVPRIFEAKVEQDAEVGINYSGVQPFTVTPVSDRYRFDFTMQASSDYDARVAFNAGALPHDVYLDNISLVERVQAAGDLDDDGCVGVVDLKVLADGWLTTGNVDADLNGDGRVDFADFVLFSEAWSGGGVCP